MRSPISPETRRAGAEFERLSAELLQNWCRIACSIAERQREGSVQNACRAGVGGSPHTPCANGPLEGGLARHIQLNSLTLMSPHIDGSK
jgi:hypothetical protein